MCNKTSASSRLKAMMAKSSSLRLMIFKILLVTGTLTLCFLAGEALVRAFAPRPGLIDWHEPHDRYGHFHRKNYSTTFRFMGSDAVMTVRTNSLGLRDQEYDLTDDTATRILLLGDSFTFGFGLDTERIFGTLLETLLNQGPGRFFVINAGVSNWGTLQEFLYARDHFELFRPDVVVLTFCGNDKRDIDWFLLHSKRGFKGDFSFPGKAILGRHSHLYRYLREARGHVTSAWRELGSLAKDDDIGEGPAPFVDAQTLSTFTEKDWQETLEIIKDFHLDFIRFRPNGLRLLQATAPWDETIRDRLRSIANGKDLLYVDLYEETRHLPETERRLPYDPHWSARMHELAARALYEVLVERMDGWAQQPKALPPGYDPGNSAASQSSRIR